jgi:curved DNA-binding protein
VLVEFKDYYQVMGLPRDASQDDIKRAYRKLARKYHPDVSKEADAEARFKEVGEAYEVLKDPEKRAAYDQLGSGWQQGQDFHAPPDWDAGFEFRGGGFDGGGDDFSDFFASLFGHRTRGGSGSRRGMPDRGEDHHAKVMIALEDAWRGATRSITLRVPTLDAGGHVVVRERTLNVRIPKGISPGQHIRLRGQGAPGAGDGRAGDLYLQVEFKPHRIYQIEGRDLHLHLPVAPWEAALGAAVKVPTPDGVVELKVPAGSASGRKLRLKGRGIPGQPPGDLYAVLDIALPAADSDRARALYRKMAEDFEFNPRARLGV